MEADALAKLKAELKKELTDEVVQELRRSSVLALREQMAVELKAEIRDHVYSEVRAKLARDEFPSLLCGDSPPDDRPAVAPAAAHDFRAVAPAAAAAAAHEVVVPAGAPAGSALLVSTPDGRQTRVHVPVGKSQGDTFTVGIPPLQESDAPAAATDGAPTRKSSLRKLSKMLGFDALMDQGEIVESCAIEGSMWDTPLVIGTPNVPSYASAYVTLLLALNTIVQVVFCMIVFEMASPTVTRDTVDELRTWRRNVAHNIDFYDSISASSIAQRVCAKDTGVETSASQMVMYTTLDQYLGPHDSHLLGPNMCTLALLVWLLTVAKEMSAALRIVSAVWATPSARATSLATRDDGEKVSFRAIGHWRKLCCFAVFAVRMGINLWLLWFGIKYLVCVGRDEGRSPPPPPLPGSPPMPTPDHGLHRRDSSGVRHRPMARSRPIARSSRSRALARSRAPPDRALSAGRELRPIVARSARVIGRCQIPPASRRWSPRSGVPPNARV